MNQYLDVNPEVAQAIAQGRPVVALESTIISHGMPYPQNVETALAVEKIIREAGAVPATIAILGGRLKAGLTAEEIEYLGKQGQKVTKASRRDLSALVARGADGATTVTTTMMIAHMAGIKIFATGGIGGVHRGAETTMDISADLEELGQTDVMVVCAGAKAILDLPLTLEYLETHGVPVLGYQTEELPAFYTRTSGLSVDYRVDTPQELAQILKTHHQLGLKGGILVTNPIPPRLPWPTANCKLHALPEKKALTATGEGFLASFGCGRLAAGGVSALPVSGRQDDQRALEGVPVQGLAAAVAEILVFPLHGDVAARADGIGVAVAQTFDLPNGHGPAKGHGRPQFPLLLIPSFHDSVPIATGSAKGFRSSTSSTSAMRHSSLMVGFALPCSMRRR